MQHLRIALRDGFSVLGRAAVIAIIAACVFLTLWWVPKEQVASLRGVKGIDPKDVFKAENEARATLAQILGGSAVLVGLYFAWKNIAATNKNLELAKEGQITERFTKAIDQLGAVDEHGKPKLEVRLGGIYALERIARDSEKDHWPIIEILTAYVRGHAAAALDVRDESSDDDEKPLAEDIQAILTVVGRRIRTYGKGEDQGLDLEHAHLAFGARLEGANLTNANLFEANLAGANLRNANLENARLMFANLESAELIGAHLENANLVHAKLKAAELVSAHLAGAHLGGTSLTNTYLHGTDLSDADLKIADLNGADQRKPSGRKPGGDY